MSRLILLLFLILLLKSQETIHVMVSPLKNPFTVFETKLIENLVEILNKKEEKKYHLKFTTYKRFGEVFETLRSNDSKIKDHYMAIDKISILPEREKKFDFSLPYMNNNYYAVLTLKTNRNKNKKFQKNHVYACGSNTIFEEYAKMYKKKFGIKYKSFDTDAEAYKALKKGEVDYIISDFIDSWIFKIPVAFTFADEKKEQIGILFPKDSKLKNKINAVMNYFLKSPKFYKLIKQQFGEGAIKFFKQE